MAAKQGCIGLTGTNARPTVAPTFGVEGMFGTNPLTLGVPTDEAFDFNFDAATSITQNGKLEYYERIGENLHAGTVVGADGKAIEGDAGAALKAIGSGNAALTTLGGIGEDLGGYKGYGLSLIHISGTAPSVVVAQDSGTFTSTRPLIALSIAA